VQNEKALHPKTVKISISISRTAEGGRVLKCNRLRVAQSVSTGSQRNVLQPNSSQPESTGLMDRTGLQGCL
jgi:hypothetical protein